MKGFGRDVIPVSRRLVLCRLLCGAAFAGLAPVTGGMAMTQRIESAKEFLIFFNKEVPIGASRKEIEEFLKQQGISFGWNKYYKRENRKPGRYDAIIRNVSPFHSISIRIYLDENGNLEYCEAFDSYTGL